MRLRHVISGMIATFCLVAPQTGRAQEPITEAPKDVSVQVFLSSTCPINNGYAPELQRLRRDYIAKGITFAAVYSAEHDRKAASGHAKQFGLTGYRVVHDSKQDYARKAGITTTPEVAVWDARGVLRYRGRIDDRYAALGVRRETARKSDLRNALNALVAGKAVPVPRTRAIGCVLPKLESEKSKP
ncbi:MAG: redoxin domain-containing protein [Fibrella sp.]|nr:redoxin domain-containing protein [Armatimonadota bacterium]